MTRLLAITLCAFVAGPLLAGQAKSLVSHQRPASSSTALKRQVSLQRDLMPVFRASCTMCHRGDSPMGGLDLTQDAAYSNLVGIQATGARMARVTPGKPERSYIYYKVSGKNALVGGDGFGMPLGGALPAAETELIRRWIRQGARNN